MRYWLNVQPLCVVDAIPWNGRRRTPIQRDPTPAYLQAQEAILERIADGTYPPGSQLPPETDLAQSERVSRHTLRRALGNLEMMGHIERSHGGGTFVAQTRAVIEISLDTYESLHPHLTSRQGYKSQMNNLSINKESADQETAQRLALTPGAPVTKVSFVVDVDDIPIAYFDFFTPDAVVPVSKMRSDFEQSLVDFFDGCNDRPRLDSYRMEVREVRAEPFLAELLSVSTGRTLFLFDGELLDEHDKTIGISMGYFVPECVRITVDRMAVVHEHTKQCS
jgi:GntR family transcriptional regulator